MMKQIKTLNIADSQSLMEEWIKHEGTTLPSLDSFYLQIRTDLQELFNKAMESLDESKSRNDYYIDVIFGVKLYEYLKDKPWFNIRIASDIGFWRYLSIKFRIVSVLNLSFRSIVLVSLIVFSFAICTYNQTERNQILEGLFQ